MSSKLETCFVAILVVIVLAMTTSSLPLQTENDAGGSIYNLVYLGAVDGKMYFYEKIPRNYTEAQKMCNASEMRIATITSQDQATFLKHSRIALGYNAYWVAARETQTLSRYEWEYNGEGLNQSPVQLYPTGLPPVTECLYYHSNFGQYVARTCSASHTYTLCEIIS